MFSTCLKNSNFSARSSGNWITGLCSAGVCAGPGVPGRAITAPSVPSPEHSNPAKPAPATAQPDTAALVNGLSFKTERRGEGALRPVILAPGV